MTKLRVVTVILAAISTGLILGGSSLAQSSVCLPDSNPDEHHPWGLPDGTPASNELVVHHDYELSQNTTTRFADWVAYFLDGSTYPGDDRSRNYRLDPCVDPDDQVSDDDYDGAYGEFGYDRGHLAPLATFEASEHWDEVNFMTNIAPMHQTLNRGVWAGLEGAIRDIASPNGSDYYVLTGTAYEDNESMPELPNAIGSHRVPSDYWKIVATDDSDDPENFHATAFLFDQHSCVVDEGCTFSSQYRENRVPVDEVENLTGFDFFSELPDAREMEIESKVGAWPPGPPNGNGGPDGNIVINSVDLRSGANGTMFAVTGQGIERTSVEVYSLDGSTVFNAETAGNTLSWNHTMGNGQPVANGVYLYRVTVEGANGETVTSQVKKLVVVR